MAGVTMIASLLIQFDTIDFVMCIKGCQVKAFNI